jgi:hypothetical protein
MVAGSAEPDGSGGLHHRAQADRSLLLLRRMQAGDRQAAALFITENADLIRRRFRKRISRSVRRLFDSQDLISTLGRRLDRIVGGGTLGAASIAELWSLVMVLARCSLSEHSDKAMRHREFRDEETGTEGLTAWTAEPQGGANLNAPGGGALLERCIQRLGNGTDATILMLRVGGLSHGQIAEQLGISIEATRKRWQRIRSSLRAMGTER